MLPASSSSFFLQVLITFVCLLFSSLWFFFPCPSSSSSLSLQPRASFSAHKILSPQNPWCVCVCLHRASFLLPQNQKKNSCKLWSWGDFYPPSCVEIFGLSGGWVQNLFQVKRLDSMLNSWFFLFNPILTDSSLLLWGAKIRNWALNPRKELVSTVNPSFLSSFQASHSSFSSTRKNETRETDHIEEEESVPSIKSKAFKHWILLLFLGRRIKQDIDHIILLAALFVSCLLFLHLMLSLLHSQGPDLGGESSSPLLSPPHSIFCAWWWRLHENG